MDVRKGTGIPNLEVIRKLPAGGALDIIKQIALTERRLRTPLYITALFRCYNKKYIQTPPPDRGPSSQKETKLMVLANESSQKVTWRRWID